MLATMLLSSPYQSPSSGTYMPVLISNTMNTPLINCLSTSSLVMPSWTFQTSPVTSLSVHYGRKSTSMPPKPPWMLRDCSTTSALFSIPSNPDIRVLFSWVLLYGSVSCREAPVFLPLQNFFLTNPCSWGSVDTPSVAKLVICQEAPVSQPPLVGIYSLPIDPGPGDEKHQSIQLESDFLHLLLFSSVEQGLAVGMTGVSTPPFTYVPTPCWSSGTLG
jgi:hypothetical protein